MRQISEHRNLPEDSEGSELKRGEQPGYLVLLLKRVQPAACLEELSHKRNRLAHLEGSMSPVSRNLAERRQGEVACLVAQERRSQVELGFLVHRRQLPLDLELRQPRRREVFLALEHRQAEQRHFSVPRRRVVDSLERIPQ